MIIWSAVVAGCGIIALLGRHAAIYRFGTDDFTGNILFAVFFILFIGLYVSLQPVFETIFKRLFSQRTPTLMVAEMPNGEQVVIPAKDESVNMMHCSSTAQTQVSEICEADIEFDDDSTYSEFEILDRNDGLCHVLFVDGSEAYVGEGLSEDEIMAEKAYLDNLDDDYPKEKMIERHTFIPHGDGCTSFEEYMSGKSFEEIEEAYSEWLSLQPANIQEDIKCGNTHVRVTPLYDTPVGCFSSIGFENRIAQESGKFIIEHEEHDVYVSADGQPYFLTELEEALKAYEIRKEHGEIPDEILVQKKQCETAHKELQEEDMKFSLAQIEFLCAYITHMMQPYLEVDELHKLHHNAKIWTVNAAPPFTPVNLRSNHLTKEDLKHLGYNVGKFLRLQGGVIARFVKKVFEKPFESTNVRTIEQKLRESKSTKERIPIHTADQMDKMFAHFQRYGNINPGILNKK
ncbi:MAG: hypothetical protein NC453_07475 [Muribaculum sp.]|nr:hypothetical protein [Muribaculum sp.]